MLLADSATWISSAGRPWTKNAILATGSPRPLTAGPPQISQYDSAAVVVMTEKDNEKESKSMDFWVRAQRLDTRT